MTKEDYELFAQMDPALLARFLGMGTLDERAALLGQEQDQGLDAIDYQLRQAEALRRPSGKEYTTTAGAALGGLGDIFRGVAGGLQEKRALGERGALLERTRAGHQHLLGQKDRGREDYAREMARVLRARFGAKPAAPAGIADASVSDAALLEPLVQEQTDHAGHGMLASRTRYPALGLQDLRNPFLF